MRVLSISVHGLEMPVVECPCIARGACPFLCPWSAWCFVYCTSAHVQQIRTTVLYVVGTKKGRPTNHVRTKFHLIERMALRMVYLLCDLRCVKHGETHQLNPAELASRLL